MMRNSKAAAALCLLLAAAEPDIMGQGSGQAGGKQASGGIPFHGLTGTLASLLASKPGSYVSIGTATYLLESMIDDDLARNFNCDSVIGEYLDSADEPNYETLAGLMEAKIREGFDGEDGSRHVSVEATGEGANMRFSFYAYRDRPVTLPISLASKDGAFQASCRAQCLARFEFSAEIKADSVLVNRDEPAKGIEFNISECTLRLVSRYDDGAGEPYIEGSPEESAPVEAEAEFKYRELSEKTDTARLKVDQTKKWYFQSPDYHSSDDGSEPEFLPYETFLSGRFSWEDVGEGQIGLWSSARAEAGERPPEGSGLAFDYTADDMGPERAERLYAYYGEWIELELPTDGAKDRSGVSR